MQYIAERLSFTTPFIHYTHILQITENYNFLDVSAAGKQQQSVNHMRNNVRVFVGAVFACVCVFVYKFRG